MSDTIDRLAHRARYIYGRRRFYLDKAATRLGFVEPEEVIARDAQGYWSAPSGNVWESDCHWRGHGIFANDDDLWLSIGRDHVRLYQQFARAVGFDRPLRRIVDWGCGGGANAYHFAPLTEEFVGVDVSQFTLEECERQAKAGGGTGFVPVVVDIERPENTLAEIQRPVDLFLCVYVFEVLPTPEYGMRILRIAEQLLAPGGLALIQFKYTSGNWRTESRRRKYNEERSTMTSYRIEDFWTMSAGTGLTPKLVSLMPQHVLDERYAYALLVKEGPESASA